MSFYFYAPPGLKPGIITECLAHLGLEQELSVSPAEGYVKMCVTIELVEDAPDDEDWIEQLFRNAGA